MLLFDKIFRACLMKNRYNAPRPTTLYTSPLSILDFFRNKSSHYFLLPHINGLPSHYGCSLLFFSRWKIPVPKERVIISLYSKAYIRRWENGALSLSLFFTLKISFRVIWWGKKEKRLRDWVGNAQSKPEGPCVWPSFVLLIALSIFPQLENEERRDCFVLNCASAACKMYYFGVAQGEIKTALLRDTAHTPHQLLFYVYVGKSKKVGVAQSKLIDAPPSPALTDTGACTCNERKRKGGKNAQLNEGLPYIERARGFCFSTAARKRKSKK